MPVLRAHSEAISLELDKPMSPAEGARHSARAPGIKLVDDATAGEPFSMPFEASGDPTSMSAHSARSLQSPMASCCSWPATSCWKGAAWNAVRSPKNSPNPRRWGGGSQSNGRISLTDSGFLRDRDKPANFYSFG